MMLPQNFYSNRKLEQLVENRTSYSVNNAELNIYETHHYAEKVVLQFSQPVLASMLEGKKVMHLRDANPFSFLPGESISLPADEVMCIDFPEAKEKNPTRCLAMQMDHDLVKNVIDNMNDNMPRVDDTLWEEGNTNFVFTNDQAIHQLLQRLIYVFLEDNTSKEYFIDLMMRELIVRINQVKNLENYQNNLVGFCNASRMSFVLSYIQEHIHEPLTVSLLAEKACMSEPNFHRVFRNEIGMTPISYINKTRIKKATSMLKDPQVQLREVFVACGFTNFSYFSRIFKKEEGVSPKNYQRRGLR
ncbi:MAG: AraC family transcriptional regulator [Bacteroidota bacterium]